MIKIYVRKEGRKVSILRTEGVKTETKDDIFRIVFKSMIGIKSNEYKVIIEK